MDLIERYLQAVRTFLPKDQQDDIIRELRANLEAQIEDREGQLGRSLSQAEIEKLLREHGHPMVVASRYRPTRHLVGPIVFPYFWIAVKISLGASLLIALLQSLGGLGNGDLFVEVAGRLASFPFRFLHIALPIFAVVTLAAAAVELFYVRGLGDKKWSFDSLPNAGQFKKDFSFDFNSMMGSCDRPKRNLTWKAWSRVLGQGLFVFWWALIPAHPFVVFGPAMAYMKLGPAWDVFHHSVLVLALLGLALHLIPVFKPRLLVLHAIAEIGNAVVGLLIVKAIFGSGDVVAIQEIAKGNADLVRSIDLINRIVSLSQVVMSIAMTFAIVGKVVKWVKRLAFDAAPQNTPEAS